MTEKRKRLPIDLEKKVWNNPTLMDNWKLIKYILKIKLYKY